MAPIPYTYFGESSIQYAMDTIYTYKDEQNILKFKFKMFEWNRFYSHIQYARETIETRYKFCLQTYIWEKVNQANNN